MKKNSRTLHALLMALVVFASCSDDDTGTLGKVSFYGVPYQLSQGAVYHDNNHTVVEVTDYVFEDRYQGENGEQVDRVQGFATNFNKEEETGNFLVGLYEDSFVLSDMNQEARGKGAAVWFRIASSDFTKLEPGKYTLSPNAEKFTCRGYYSASYNTNYDPSAYFDGTYGKYKELKEGEVEITQAGEEYTVTFNCKSNNEGVIQGSFTGPLKAYDIQDDGIVATFNDIQLEALFDKVEYTDEKGVFHSEPDYRRATSFLSIATQNVYSANTYKDEGEDTKKSIDVALAYDKDSQSVYFESPIKMRALLWHNTYESEELSGYSFDLPCHTKYMLAPPDFSNADFEALSSVKDFDFNLTDASEAKIPVNASMPCFVFAQTGNGLRCVIRVNRIKPVSSEVSGGITYAVNPLMELDVRLPESFTKKPVR